MSSESGKTSLPDLTDPVVVGTVASAHGVRGTLRVKSPGGGKHLREGVSPVVGGVRRRILRARETPKGFLVDLDGVGDRDAASGLRGAELFLDRAELDAPDEDEFYVGDLVGLDVFEEAGERLGSVVDVFETPAHEVLVVEDDDETHYVPFISGHVPEVHLEAGRVVVRLPRG